MDVSPFASLNETALSDLNSTASEYLPAVNETAFADNQTGLVNATLANLTDLADFNDTQFAPENTTLPDNSSDAYVNQTNSVEVPEP